MQALPASVRARALPEQALPEQALPEQALPEQALPEQVLRALQPLAPESPELELRHQRQQASSRPEPPPCCRHYTRTNRGEIRREATAYERA